MWLKYIELALAANKKIVRQSGLLVSLWVDKSKYGSQFQAIDNPQWPASRYEKGRGERVKIEVTNILTFLENPNTRLEAR